MRPLSYDDARKVLKKLTGARIVLIGGQAINFWAEYYSSRVEELAAEAPFTSKDIDFCGAREAVKECAQRLSAEFVLPKDFDPTPNTGAVIFVDDEGTERQIDFLGRPFGLDEDDVFNTAIPANPADDEPDDAASKLLIMHPERCMESRIHNIIGLSDSSEKSLKQLRASVFCAREFQKDLIEDGYIRDALTLNERIFQFCHYNLNGRVIHVRTGIDPFDAVVSHPALPVEFNTLRYPQMKQWLSERRKRIR
ncbi:MAG TPA: hypothetical protein VL242_47300 [Sorangium sp.]|nr:hypothetical protein [Sorangium sp.]